MSGNGVLPRSTAAGLTVGTGHQMSPGLANSLRVTAVVKRLAVNLHTAGDGSELVSLCLSLARGIDFALANNEAPVSVQGFQDLPRFLKQLCECRSDIYVQAAIMVLMISVKNACAIGWFPEDSEALLNLANEIANGVCCQGFVSNMCIDSSSMLLTVMSRFQPLMKMGMILSSLEIKPGYEAYLMDFHISKNTGQSPQEKIRLFVVQTDNIETSACLISPQKVSFLLNGRGVEKRTNVSMELGPQPPTNVTGMLKYGTNIVQAVGQFDGHYLIAVAFVSMTPFSETPMLEDYVQSGVPALDPDSEIIEGPSRISLNCPISRKRIRTPVKGKSCKHYQCSDFRSYVEINSKNPSWRCPDCNQPCCYTDLRTDQNIVKVLQEVGADVNDVFISADGSWKAVFGSDKILEQSLERPLSKGQPEQPEARTSTAAPDVLDLTDGDDKMNCAVSSDNEDRKPSKSTLQSQAPADSTVAAPWNNTDDILEYVDSQPGPDFWSNLLQASGSMTPGSRSGTPVMSVAPPLCTVPNSTVIPGAVSASPNREVGIDLASAIPASVNLPLQQQSPIGSTNNECRRLLQAYMHSISREDEGVAVRSQTPIPQQMPRHNIIPGISGGSHSVSLGIPVLRAGTPAGSSPASHGTATFRGPVNYRQHMPRSNWDQARAQVPSQTIQQVGGFQIPNPPPRASTISFGFPSGHHNLAAVQQALRVPNSRSQVPGPTQSSFQHNPGYNRQGSGQVGVGVATSAPANNQAGFVSAYQQTARPPPSLAVQTASAADHRARESTTEQRGSVGGAVPAAPQFNGSENSPSDQNWRPTGRMRGSISGRDFETLKDMVIQPSQPSQVPRPLPTHLTPRSSRPGAPPSSRTSAPPLLQPSVHTSAPPHLQPSVIVNRTIQVPRPPSSSATEPSHSGGNPGSLPR